MRQTEHLSGTSIDPSFLAASIVVAGAMQQRTSAVAAEASRPTGSSSPLVRKAAEMRAYLGRRLRAALSLAMAEPPAKR